MTAQPPAATVANGHDVEWDPPHPLSAALRWTCRTCHATAIRYGNNEYGDAVTDPCKPMENAE